MPSSAALLASVKRSIRYWFPRTVARFRGSAPEPESWARVRSRYADLIDAWIQAGELSRAHACAREAVAEGIWLNPLQRPHWQYDRRLVDRPVYNPAEFLIVRKLEDAADEIQREVLQRTAEGGAGALPPWQSLLSRGRWEQAIFFERGRRFARTFEVFPKTGEVLDAIQSQFALPGLVSLLWLHPGSHLVPHCGHTNALLRVHLGLRVPEGACMRVGRELVVWRERKCLVFDDSFEHEVWNRGNESRVVLLLDVFHPSLPEADCQTYLRGNQLDRDEIRARMEASGLARIEMAAQGEPSVALDETNRKMIQAFMLGNGLSKVERTPDGLQLVPVWEASGDGPQNSV